MLVGIVVYFNKDLVMKQNVLENKLVNHKLIKIVGEKSFKFWIENQLRQDIKNTLFDDYIETYTEVDVDEIVSDVVNHIKCSS
jgi:hypothetical protein